MSDSKQALIDVLLKIKQRILEVEQSSIKITEQDTRQGLINELFKSLGWDFSDFNLVKSEFRHKDYNEPVDYAFFHERNKEKPLLLVEAKALGTDLNNAKIVKQLCTYLGEMGVQCGLLTDGNKYTMYNSRAGSSFEDQRFLTMQIKTADTDDGHSCDDLADKLLALLGRKCLENDEIQQAYESHVINRHIEDALSSLLTTPFGTLASAIKKEFKEERVKVDPNLKISQKQIVSYLELIQDEEGRIPIDTESSGINSDDNILHDIAQAQDHRNIDTVKDIASGGLRRVTIANLLESNFVQEGDSWRLEYKGEVTWGRVTGNGEIEVNGETFSNPTKASSTILKRSSNGWYDWKYRDSSGHWCRIRKLREQYRENQGVIRIEKDRAA